MQPARLCCGLHYQFPAVLSLSSLHVLCITNLGKKALLSPLIGGKMEKERLKDKFSQVGPFQESRSPQLRCWTSVEPFLQPETTGAPCAKCNPSALQSKQTWPWHGVMESQNLTMAYVGKDLKNHPVQISLLQAVLPGSKSGTRSGCPGPHPTRGLGHPQPFWAVCASSPPSQLRISPLSNISLSSFILKSFSLVALSIWLQRRGVPSFEHPRGPPLDFLHIFPVPAAPDLDAVLQVGPYGGRAEGNNPPLPAATPLLMQPKIPLTVWAASAHCWLMFSFSSTKAPMSSSTELLSRSPSTSRYTHLGLP